jgi:hypothetical protein
MPCIYSYYYPVDHTAIRRGRGTPAQKRNFENLKSKFPHASRTYLHLASVYIADVHLGDVYLGGIYLGGVYLIGVHLMHGSASHIWVYTLYMDVNLTHGHVPQEARL